MIGLDIVKNNKRKFINNYNQSQLSNIENVYKYLTNVHKLTPTQATALMGNIMQESSWNPSAKQINGDKALGLFQMHGDQLKAYQKYLQTTGKKDSLYSPLDYVVDMIKESKDSKGNLLAPHPYTTEYNRIYSLVKPYLGKSNLTPRQQNDVNYYYNTYGNRLRSGKLYLINDLQNAWNNPETSVKDLTKIFTNVFERSGNPEYDKRIGYAQEYYDYYKPSYKVGGKLAKYQLGRNIELSNDAIQHKQVVPLEYILPIPKMTNSQRRDLFLQNNQTYLNSDNRERSERQRGNRQAAIDRQVQREALQKQKNEEAFENLINVATRVTSPSTYIEKIIGKPLTGAAALVADAIPFGAGAWAGRVYKNILKARKLGQQDYLKILSMPVSELRSHPVYNKVPYVWKIREYKVPKNIKDAFNTTVTQRLTSPAERQIAHDILKKPYNIVPSILFEKAGYKGVHGLHFPKTEVISVNKLQNQKPWQLEEILMHELRHQLDNRNLTHINRNVTPLNVAYNDNFTTLPQYNKQLEGINMEPEVITTNLDTRNNLLPEYMKHNNYPVELQNQYINAQDDARIFGALRNSNAYGKAYYNRLQDLGLLNPNTASYLRQALVRIPAVSIPIGLTGSQLNNTNNE